MKIRLLVLAGLLFAAMLLPITASNAHTVKRLKDRDAVAIETVIFDYFEGNGTADRDRLGAAFHEDLAVMVGIIKSENGTLERRAWHDMPALLDSWAAVENPPGTGRDGEVLHIQTVDGRIATALFRYTDEFYDAFTLLKHDGQWKIASKAFIEQ